MDFIGRKKCEKYKTKNDPFLGRFLSLGNQVFDFLKREAGVFSTSAGRPMWLPQGMLSKMSMNSCLNVSDRRGRGAPREGLTPMFARSAPPLIGAAVRILRLSSAGKPGEP